MRLALSSAAAPDATLAELRAAGARRGIYGVELEEGHGHGIGPGAAEAEPAARRAVRDATGGPVAAFRLRRAEDALDERTVRFAAVLGAPVVAAVEAAAGGAALIREAGPRYADAGAVLLVACRGGPEPMRALREAAAGRGAVGLAWDVVPAAGRADDLLATLEAAGDRLRHVRLYGGGPESAAQEGLGIGALMGALARAGFDGTIALAPSTPRYRVAWSAWLGRRGGWGCGSEAGGAARVPRGAVER